MNRQFPTAAAAGVIAQNGEVGTARLRRLHQRAEACRHSGDSSGAAAAYEQALQIAPEHVATLLALAELHLEAGRHNRAHALAMRAVRGHLESPLVAIHLLRVLGQLSESGMVVEIVRQLPPPMWDSAKSLAEVSQILSLLGAHEPARTFACAGVERDPRHPPSLVMRATVDVFFGDIDSAFENAERCLEILPDDPSSHWLISRMRRPGPERRIGRIEAALDRVADPEAEALLAYALHNELHEMRDYPRAWDALARGCRAKRSTFDYTTEAAQRLFDGLLHWNESEVRTGDGFDDDGPVPIFVIGLHRSGTTLAERILSGHTQVAQGGETYDIRAQLRRASGLHFAGDLDVRIIEAREALDYRAIGKGYLESMAWRRGNSPFFTDKLPSNYYNVGFIARALPRARFIFLKRDPVDVGLSSLRTLFANACHYSYDPLEYAAHYRNFRRLADHWLALLPDRILEIDYDRLVGEPGETAAEMARFCGLDYEPSMIAIEKRSDAVATASSVMMREGIRKDRGKLWKAYEAQLAPMIEALGVGGDAS